MTRGITGYGIRVPQYHVTAEAYEEAYGRFAARIDRKAVPAYDEDAVTLAIGAADDIEVADVGTLAVATTSHPQDGTLASGPLARAVGLDGQCRTLEFGTSWKAGVEALDAALRFGSSLAVASDAPHAPFGDDANHGLGAGAAAFAVGGEDPVATAAGSAHYVDAHLPAKFLSEEGVTDLGLGAYTSQGVFEALSEVVTGALDDAGLGVDDVDHVVLPQDDVKMSWRTGHRLGFDGDQMGAGFVVKRLGFVGAATPLIGLAASLDAADAGETVLVAGYGYGHGASAHVFETTAVGAETEVGVEAALESTEELSFTDYVRYWEVSE
jgi:3-hydroxy-3-methylglutaryl CoA synthase